MAGWDGIWGGLAAGAAVTALGLGALSITARQPAGNRLPEAPAVAPPEVASPALADAAAVTSASLAGFTAPSVLRPLARPGTPPGSDGAGAAIDTTPAAIPEAVTPATALVRPETGEAPAPPAGEARAPATASADRPGVPPGDDAPAPPDASLARASLPPKGDATASVGPPQLPPATMAPPAPIPVTAEVAPSAPAAPPDPRPTLAGRSEGALAASRDRRPGAEVTQSAAPLAATAAPLGGWSMGPAATAPTASTTGSGLDASARPAPRDAVPVGRAPARLVAPDATRARPAAEDASQAPSRPPVAAPPADAAPAAPEDALHRFAASFAAPADGRALLSVVLLDQGSPDGPAEVAALPWPVSVALDPAAPGAAERMAAYRARGIEVLALAGRPAGAQAVNEEARAEAKLTALPEAVAVLDLGEAGLEPGLAAGPMLGHLAERGLGVVLSARGSGAAARLTAAGLPAAAVLRDLDGAGQDAAAVRRFLDDSARRAGEDGAGVVLARVRPETLDALALWAEGRRARDVALAPVSAVLRDAAPDGTESRP